MCCQLVTLLLCSTGYVHDVAMKLLLFVFYCNIYQAKGPVLVSHIMCDVFTSLAVNSGHCCLFVVYGIFLFRPGGELKHEEDQIEGLKRLLTEV